MIQVQRFNKALKLAVILGDLVILNVLFISFNSIWNELFGERAYSGTLPQILTLFSVCYFACTISGGVILHRRGARADQIVFRALRNVFYFSLLSTSLIVLSELEIYSNRFFVYYFILLFLCITFYRLLFRFCIQLYRSRGGNFRTVLYLGSTENIAELYHEMTSDATTGYRVLGYFDTTPNAKFPASCTYLGKPEQTIDYLTKNKVNQLYCCLPSALTVFLLIRCFNQSLKLSHNTTYHTKKNIYLLLMPKLKTLYKMVFLPLNNKKQIILIIYLEMFII